MITRFTMTGADDSIQPADLLSLTKEFPFVEWGILLSRTSTGRTRFPSREWLDVLTRFKQTAGRDLAFSGHLCGGWVRQILLGYFEPNAEPDLTLETFNVFDRIQINTHGQAHSFNDEGLDWMAKEYGKEFIFQYDEANNYVVQVAHQKGIVCSALFDLSHGVGKLPSKWPNLLVDTKCGYAGGLSPENLKEQIGLIEEKAGDAPIWIDMETHVRSDNDRLFDLDKVRKCLEIAAPYIRQLETTE